MLSVLSKSLRVTALAAAMGIGADLLACAQTSAAAEQKPTPALRPSEMPKLGTVDARYLSYNVEMVESSCAPLMGNSSPRLTSKP
jgi:hypothetical protein